MEDRPLWPGTSGSEAGSPARQAGSVRRTSSVDIVRPDGPDGDLVLRGRARDILTTADGRAEDLDTADSLVRVTGTDVSSVELRPDPHGVADVVTGVPVAKVRHALDRHVPELARSGSLIALLLDEIPVAALISGSALARSGAIATPSGGRSPMIGICAGWVEGGAMARSVEEGELRYLGQGPPAPSLHPPDDDEAWHEMEDLPPGGMRRRRRLDLLPGDPTRIDVLFRDSFIEANGVETAVHEYGIDLTVDPGSRRVQAIAAIPHVLPGPECPNAADSAQRLVGLTLAELRPHVRATFAGVPTCTHLNDALRSIGDLDSLLAHLVPA